MKVIIFGHNGWIGSMMCTLLEKEKDVTIIRPIVRANNSRDVNFQYFNT